MLNSIAGILSEGALAVVGDFESIATVTVGAGGASSVSFTSIPSTYKHLQLRISGKWATAANDYMLISYNSNTTGTDYNQHSIYGDGTSAAASYSINTRRLAYFSGNQNSVVISDLLDYTNTNKVKTTRTLCGYDNNGAGLIMLSSLWFNTLLSISSITLTSDSSYSFAQYSSFALYGIKG